MLPLVAPDRHCEGSVHARSLSLRQTDETSLTSSASAARPFAADSEQWAAALRAVALPAGTTIGQRHLPRVSDHHFLTADAPCLRAGILCL